MTRVTKEKNYYLFRTLIILKKERSERLANKINRSQSNKVKEVFFGQDNISRIQKMIRREVYNRTDGKYSMDCDQDYNKLTKAFDVNKIGVINVDLIDSVGKIYYNSATFYEYDSKLNDLEKIAYSEAFKHDVKKKRKDITIIFSSKK